jgi:D-amino-acid oxidase
VYLARYSLVVTGESLTTSLAWWEDTIPRASGDVILGGFKTDNDWTAHAVASQTTDILERCIAMAPDLIPVEKCKDRDPKLLVEELRKLIVEEGAGLRPARKGGVRIESEDLVLGNGTVVVPLVHHYGYGMPLLSCCSTLGY